MGNDIILSYILPCYNTGKYVKQCIESLYRQNLPIGTFEVVFVNNATEDNSEEIVFELKKKYSNLVYVKLQQNICSGGAYNEGLKVARGKYVQFVDSDDYLADNSMASLITTMEKYNLEVLQCNLQSFDENGKLTNEENLRFNGNLDTPIDVSDGNGYLTKALKEKSYDILPVPAYRKLIRRSFLTENNLTFTPTTIGTDYLHNLQLLSKVKRMKVISEPIYMFRYNPNGVTKSKMTSTKIIYALNNYCRSVEILRESPFSEEIKNIIYKELKSTINSYLSGMLNLNARGMKDVYDGIKYQHAIKEMACGFAGNLLINAPRVMQVLNKTIGMFPLKVAIKLASLCR